MCARQAGRKGPKDAHQEEVAGSDVGNGATRASKINISSDVHRRLAHYAIDANRSIASLAEEFIQRGLAAAPPLKVVRGNS